MLGVLAVVNDKAEPVKVGSVIKSLPEQVEALTVSTAQWFRTDSEDALVMAAVAVALYFLFIGVRWGLVRMLGASGDVTTWKGFVGRIVRRTRSPFMASLAAYAVVHVVAPPGDLRAAIDFIFVVAAVIQGALWLREIILAMVERRAELSDDPAGFNSAMGVIRVLVNVAIWMVAVILVLDNVGVNVTALVAGLGVGGIAIALAAQGIFADLFAALAILFDRPFRVGDSIHFGTNTGMVEAIGLKTVRVRLLSGEQLVIGNTQLLAQEVSNIKRIEVRRIVLPFGVIYQTKPAMLMALPDHVKGLIEPVEHARFDRCVFTGFGDSSIDFELVFFVDSPELEDMLVARHAIGVGMVQMFADLGVEFAYPTQVTFTAMPDGTMIDPRPMIELPAQQA